MINLHQNELNFEMKDWTQTTPVSTKLENSSGKTKSLEVWSKQVKKFDQKNNIHREKCPKMQKSCE